MPTKKSEKSERIKIITVKTEEILVAKNRSSEARIKSFVAAPENVSQDNLGTLVGVFSVSDQSESSGFVVNALLSAIRKEYFANPRRGAIESFEAALHRMNLALSEFVKNGQAAWVGNLHGSVAVIEKHSIHFSVTGSGRILLFRSESLSDISDGLASEEASLHPMKTFVEISSGRLNPGDCILLASPEVFELFSDDSLERSARRLVPERKFFRFLETAMKNDVHHGAAIVLSAEEHSEAPPLVSKTTRNTKRPLKKASNVFSADTFKEAAEARAEIFKEEPPITIAPKPDHVSRFGEIYVQGEALDNKEEHPAVTKFRWIIEDAKSFSHGLWLRVRERMRQRRERLWVATSGTITSLRLKMIRQRKASVVVRQAEDRKKDMGTPSPETSIPEPAPPDNQKRSPFRTLHFRVPSISISKAFQIPKTRIPNLRASQIRNIATKITSKILIPGSKHIVAGINIGIRAGTEVTKKTFFSLKSRFVALPSKQQLIVASSAAFMLTLGGVIAWSALTKETPEAVPVVITGSSAPSFPPEEESRATLASPDPIATLQENIIAPIFLNDTLYLATETGLYDTVGRETFPSPFSETSIRHAAGMDDLNLIFLMTEEGRLFAFAPSNRSFVENSLRLPSGFRPAGIGTFLTYLYVLGKDTGQIYRFPRAEGGFGDGLLWTKTSMNPDTESIAVSEHIYGISGSTVQSFFRGNGFDGFSQEPTATPLSTSGICASEDVPDRFVVIDSDAKRVIAYGADGAITGQYFHESFGNASACSLSRDGNTVAVSIGKDASLIRLPQ